MRGDLRQAAAVDRIGDPAARAPAIVLDDDDTTSRPHTLGESCEDSGGILHEVQRVRRQHPIDRFIVDFCCAELRVIVELDGKLHDTQAEYDALRTQMLEDYGYRVLRFTNSEVENDIDAVLRIIRTELTQMRHG